jgi:2-iminobutanoate/2-iminopropanoate deaminase
MTAISAINPPDVYLPEGFSYSHAVRLGDLIFVAGQVAQDRDGQVVGKGDPRAQAERAFANLRSVLEAAGSGVERVVKVTVLITDLAYRPIVHEVRSKFFANTGFYPASTLAVVKNLALPEFLIEVEAIAAVR